MTTWGRRARPPATHNRTIRNSEEFAAAESKRESPICRTHCYTPARQQRGPDRRANPGEPQLRRTAIDVLERPAPRHESDGNPNRWWLALQRRCARVCSSRGHGVLARSSPSAQRRFDGAGQASTVAPESRPDSACISSRNRPTFAGRKRASGSTAWIPPLWSFQSGRT
jgi:hypothetical protein